MFEGGGIWFALEAWRQIVPGLSAQRDEAAEPEFIVYVDLKTKRAAGNIF